MKNKKLLKKIIIWVLVIGIIGGAVAFFLTSGDDAEEIKLDPVSVFSVYLPTGDTTTEEDILNVERDINNTLLVEANCAVKFYMAPLDRYETMLASAKEMMLAYNENNSKSVEEKLGFEYKFDYATSTFTWKCDEDAVTPSVVYNSDTVIDLLDEGIEIYPNNPSIDIAVLLDYEDYYAAYDNEELVRLDTLLENEIKELKQSIPPLLFAALSTETGDKGIYGIPTVRPIGEYEYMVFDKDLLDKYGLDKNQMTSVEDLESYLEKVAAGENGAVIPLLNTPSTTFYEMYKGQHSLGVTDNGQMVFPYADNAFQKYYTTLARYRSLGYIGASDATIEGEKFAVAFFKGTKEEVEALAESTGKNLVYNGGDDGSKPFAKPIASDMEVGEAVYCVFGNPYSSYAADSSTSSADQKKAVDFLRLLNKKSAKQAGDIKNILLYGAPGIHYTLSNTDDSVIFLNDNEGKHTYSMYNIYTGNTFHAYNCYLDGYNVTDSMKEQGLKHNLDLVASKYNGYVFEVPLFSFDDGSTLASIDYLAIVDEICNKYYEDYINGTIGAVDMEEFDANVAEEIRSSVAQALAEERKKLFEEALTEQFKKEIEADPVKMQAIKTEAETNAVELMFNTAKAELEAELRNKYEPYGYTEEQITAQLAKDLTDDAVNAYIEENYDEAKREEFVNRKIYGDEATGELGYLHNEASIQRKLRVTEIETGASAVAQKILDAMKAAGEVIEDEDAKLSALKSSILYGNKAALGTYANIYDSEISAGTYNNEQALAVNMGSEEFNAIVESRVLESQEEQYDKLLDQHIAQKLTDFGIAIVKEVNEAYGKAYEQYLKDNAKYADQIMAKQTSVDVTGLTDEGGIYEGIYADKNNKAVLFVSYDGKAVDGSIMKGVLQMSYYDLKGEPK